MASTENQVYDGELTEEDIPVYHHVSISHVDNVRARRLGFGKKSGRERLLRAMRIAFRRYLDDIEAGRVTAPPLDE